MPVHAHACRCMSTHTCTGMGAGSMCTARTAQVWLHERRTHLCLDAEQPMLCHLLMRAQLQDLGGPGSQAGPDHGLHAHGVAVCRPAQACVHNCTVLRLDFPIVAAIFTAHPVSTESSRSSSLLLPSGAVLASVAVTAAEASAMVCRRGREVKWKQARAAPAWARVSPLGSLVASRASPRSRSWRACQVYCSSSTCDGSNLGRPHLLSAQVVVEQKLLHTSICKAGLQHDLG